ncbi:50S ribosomal protein L15 [Candidatus Nomurabacteria bacterium]|uniref:Large ribosomal subunit protein uL15 n=1 Tax=candidate division WWE3 bacterium TaxID=2053526 RepID=A0A955DZY5_UNCKA|nr:50S ribosomal protein L15 [candidate division WWE3 bacterium]MCB9823766.1 50S ribosomal protein L15 [Candidatus Nomurabacteria bacterium]MCB9826828.1 50S ribosomal protein L15 [Candidatus Nomurabacteria bacterium]MCB9827561.1 50S ribosomal protein L15 [Candidatus Nomurabacteria bacterium]HXK52951.1 50S ribosomal protein L15 [bacterium]
MELHNLTKLKGTKRKAKRLGRGYGSGVGGHVVGFGQKGQKARSGNSIPFGFEGGQVPLYKKMPEIGGFRNPTAKSIVGISVSRLNKFKDGSVVTPTDFVKAGILKKLPKHGVKLLNTGKIEVKVTVYGFLLSESANTALTKAGCTIK